MNGEEIGPGEAHLWYVLTAEVSQPAHLAALEALLTPEEHARRARYRMDRDRHHYLVARGLVLWLLSRYLKVPPAALQFRTGQHGKPELAIGSTPSPLKFNQSQAAGVVACAIARDVEIGLDVEDRARATDIDAVASSFARAERSDLDALRGTARQDRFLAYWTLKEAYLKARGEGLGLTPLDGFAFTLAPPAPPRIVFGPAIADDAAEWRFAQVQLRESSVAAVAMRTRLDVALTVRKTSPFLPGANPSP